MVSKDTLDLWPKSQDRGGYHVQRWKGLMCRGWVLILVILRLRDCQHSREDLVGCRSLSTLHQCLFFFTLYLKIFYLLKYK